MPYEEHFMRLVKNFVLGLAISLANPFVSGTGIILLWSRGIEQFTLKNLFVYLLGTLFLAAPVFFGKRKIEEAFAPGFVTGMAKEEISNKLSPEQQIIQYIIILDLPIAFVIWWLNIEWIIHVLPEIAKIL